MGASAAVRQHAGGRLQTLLLPGLLQRVCYHDQQFAQAKSPGKTMWTLFSCLVCIYLAVA